MLRVLATGWRRNTVLRNPRGQIVEVSSDLFSIGDGPEGVTIWAGGSGVWFEIIPGSSYKQEYENMAAAVKLYYSILDYITEAKQSRKKSLDVDKIFDAVRFADGCILPTVN